METGRGELDKNYILELWKLGGGGEYILSGRGSGSSGAGRNVKYHPSFTEHGNP